MLRDAESAVAVNEDHVGVARPLEVRPGERERRGVDVDGHDKALATHHLSRQGRAVAGPDPDLEEPVALSEAERLVEQRIAVRARDRRSPARERQGDLFVGVVAVGSRNEVLATHGEHRRAEPLGTKEPAPLELRDLLLALPSEVLVALDRRARRRNEPPVHHGPR